MNFINAFFLKIALLPMGIYQRLGVNRVHLKAILTVKLTMDDRRPNTFHQTQQKKKEEPIRMATLGTMLLSALLGFIYLIAFAFGNNVITQLTLYFSIFFFMLAATLISDFTSVLIDVRDNFIILPKPVNDRTFVVSRFLHIFIHICKLVVPMALPGLVYLSIHYGLWGGGLILVMTGMITVFTIFFINALYIVVLKTTSPQRFQSVISYFQIFFAVALYASYQIVPRMIGRFDEVQIDLSQKTYSLFIPSYWFAGGWHALYTFKATRIELAGAFFSFLFPALSLWIVVKYLAPSFNQKLALITASATENKVPGKKRRQPFRAYAHWLSSICTKEGAERVGFLFTWKMTSRSRDFKLKVYPTIGYLIVYSIIIFMNNKSVDLQAIHDQSSSGKFIIVSSLYFSSLILLMALNQMSFSDSYKAGWIYYITPVQKPGEVINGGVKAAMLKFYVPLVVILLVAGIIVIGPKALPNIVLGLFNVLFIAFLTAYVSNRQLPFSRQQNNNYKWSSVIRTMAIMVCSFIIGVIQYAIYEITVVVIILAVLSIIATWLVSNGIRNMSWQKIEVAALD